MSEPKRYRIEKITDILAVPEDKMDDFLVDLKAWCHFARSIPPLIEEVAKITSPNIKAQAVPTCMNWIDDGKHDAKIIFKTPDKDTPAH